MSFWDLADGGKVETEGKFDLGGGDLEPIPNNTGCVAAIEEAKWDEYDGDRYISLRWRVVQPGEYANRAVFQKVRVFDSKPEKADKAKRMLAAIDTNAGGKLVALGREPTDTDLMSALMGKIMAIKVMVWEMELDGGETKRGNWISAVAPYKGKIEQAPAPRPAPAPEPIDDDIDSIPF